jgi:4-hydroxy-tetrahydrodipicolinate synthase
MNPTPPFAGVWPAITTPFDESGRIDHEALAEQADGLVQAGVHGLVALGSLGEGGTLSLPEKRAVVKTLVGCPRRVPVVAAVSALATDEAVAFARTASDLGVRGLMVLPPYAYVGAESEMEAHMAAVFSATTLPCMLYNNPIAYGTDFTPEAIRRLADRHPNLVAVKESSADVRRLHALRALMGERLLLSVGVDDLLVESIAAGARGWIAGLANAFPAESMRLFHLAQTGSRAECETLYHWFLPLLRLDTRPHFVQCIKLAQERTGLGSERVRPPRLPLEGSERQEVLAVIDAAIAARPS